MPSYRAQESRLLLERTLVQRMHRRRLLTAGGAATLGAAISLPGMPTRIRAQDMTGTPLATPDAGPTVSAPTFASTPFSLGVASGDPLPTSVVLWTRLAVAPLTGVTVTGDLDSGVRPGRGHA